MRTLWLLLSIAGVAICKPTLPKCSLYRIIPCAFLIDDDKPERQGVWPAFEEEMDRHCESSLKVANCMKPFVDECTHGEFENIGNYLKAERELLDKLCTKGTDLRKRYLKNAPCVNRNFDKLVETCGHVLDFENVLKLNKEECETHKRRVACHSRETEKMCGRETLDLMKLILDPANRVMNKICDIVDDVSEQFLFLLASAYNPIPV